MHDPRLMGTWRSDKLRTRREIFSRRDIPAGKRRDALVNIFGRLTLRYTKTRSYSTFRGTTYTSTARTARCFPRTTGSALVSSVSTFAGCHDAVQQQDEADEARVG
jgi:hypothetical protein